MLAEYLRELIEANKFHLKWRKIILTKASQYEGLKIKDLQK